MSTLSVIPAEYDHIAPVAIHMRQSDLDEVAASSGRSPFEALEYSMERSTIARTVLINDKPAGMFGCGDLSILTRVGSPWLLGTDDLALAPREFLRASVDWRDKLFEQYDTLRNLVDDRNVASIRWLGWLGFQFRGPFPVGKAGLPFRLFELRGRDV
jgi:hypothetical protein